jgi:hypothetical protein
MSTGWIVVLACAVFLAGLFIGVIIGQYWQDNDE